VALEARLVVEGRLRTEKSKQHTSPPPAQGQSRILFASSRRQGQATSPSVGEWGTGGRWESMETSLRTSA